jgi:hypothetical protein
MAASRVGRCVLNIGLPPLSVRTPAWAAKATSFVRDSGSDAAAAAWTMLRVVGLSFSTFLISAACFLLIHFARFENASCCSFLGFAE